LFAGDPKVGRELPEEGVPLERCFAKQPPWSWSRGSTKNEAVRLGKVPKYGRRCPLYREDGAWYRFLLYHHENNRSLFVPIPLILSGKYRRCAND
jgi:hypothetical protein